MITDSSEKFLADKEKGVTILKAVAFKRFAWLRHGFSTRPGGGSKFPEGSYNLGFTKWDEREAVEANRRDYFARTGMNEFAVARMRQTHTDCIVIIKSPEQTKQIIVADAVITSLPRLVLAVLTADCLPILIVHPDSHTIAAIHAGWRGTAQRIAFKAVREISRATGDKSSELIAAIGPSIGACCYEVGAEVREAFRGGNEGGEKYFTPLSESPAKYTLDLARANRDQLVEAGLLQENISVNPDCTRCHVDRYFSHRGENGKTGRMMAAIATA